MAYSELEPFGPQVDNLLAGMQTAATYNVHRQKGQRPYEPADFLLAQPKRISNPKDIFAQFKRWASSYGDTLHPSG